LTTRHDEGVLADDLLAEIGAVLAVQDLRFAEPPVPLGGGYFTENHAFRLSAASPPWDGGLVVRLFPLAVDADTVMREAIVQREAAAAGFPTPAIVHFNPDARINGRRYFIMERMPGSAMLGGIGLGTLLGDGPRLLRRLTEVTVDVQVQLHAIDAAAVVDALGTMPATVDRWFEQLARLVDGGGDGFAPALRWLRSNRPAERSHPTLCHGDLHPGNILVDESGNVTAVLDWTVATIGEPALDVGFTTMALSLAPVDVPRPLQALVARGGRVMAHRYVKAYSTRTQADLSAKTYYEALRCAIEVGHAAHYRLAAARGRGGEQPRPTWDAIAGAMVRYFRRRTGVTITMPTPVATS
jgi:aminoglycoside phosphotransferase (APT) family kinase protein